MAGRGDEPGDASRLGRVIGPILVAILVGLVLWVALRPDDDLSVPDGLGSGTSRVTGGVQCASPPPVPTTYPTFDRAPDPSLAAAASWRATIVTTCGPVEVVLDGRKAPASVASFIELARAGYYSDSVCNRLTSRLAPSRFLQCGDPTGRRGGDPGYGLPLENVPADRHYAAGVVAIARGPEVGTTAGEFLFVYAPFTAPADEPVYSVIGRVVSGTGVIEHIAALGGEDHLSDWYPFTSISIVSVTVEPD